MTLQWTGDEVMADAIAGITAGLTEFGLRHETASKGLLAPGRGVITGTLRRSIHSAAPSYDFGSDDVKPSTSSPDRGGSGGPATRTGDKVRIVVGSGMRYAARVEQRHGYIKSGHDRVKGSLDAIIRKHTAARGL